MSRRGSEALLGIDLGTGSLKVMLMRPDGLVIGEASRSYPVDSPVSGAAESDPEFWWEALRSALSEVLIGGRVGVAAIGLSGQMHGIVPCDSLGRPLRPAILWPDLRPNSVLKEFEALAGDELDSLCNPLAAGMAGPMLLWLRRNEPQLFSRLHAAPQPKDWLRWRMTGEPKAEPSDASGTLLWDIAKDQWAGGIIHRLGLDPAALPPLIESRELAGSLARKPAAQLGLDPGLPVAAGAADTAAALLGSGMRQGEAQLTVGTGGQIAVLRHDPHGAPHAGVHLYRAAASGWYLLAAVQNAGLALERVRKILGLDWDGFHEEAFRIPAGAAGISFLPHLTGERTPHLDTEARGGWLGLGLHQERAHLARAAFEGVAFALREALDALASAGVEIPALRLAGGGSLDPRWRALLSSALRKPLNTVEVSSASARGAAVLAGLAIGTYASAEEAASLLPPARQVAEPENEAALEEAYLRFRGAYSALRQARQKVV